MNQGTTPELNDYDQSAGLAQFVSDTRTAASLPGKVDSPRATADEQQYIGQLLDAYRQLLGSSPKTNRKRCTGVLDPDHGQVAVIKPVDTIARTAGRTHKGAIHLQPEEWLLFYERGALVISRQDDPDGQSLGLRDVWASALSSLSFNLDAYRGYAWLRRLGYTAVCTDTAGEDTVTADKASHQHSQEQPGRDSALYGRPVFDHRFVDNVFRGLLNRAPAWAGTYKYSGAELAVGGYQLYKPDAGYKKRDPGLPQYHMVVTSSQRGFPAARELDTIARTQHQISAILGVSELGNIAFLKLRAFVVPQAF